MSDGKDPQTFVIMSKDEYSTQPLTYLSKKCYCCIAAAVEEGQEQGRKRRRSTKVRIKMSDSRRFGG